MKPTNPLVPDTGEQIVTITFCRDGSIHYSSPMTVNNRNRYSLTDEEFSATDGCRHHIGHLYPSGVPCGGEAPLSMFPTSVFFMARTHDVVAATEVCRAHFLAAHRECLAELAAKTAEVNLSVVTAIAAIS